MSEHLLEVTDLKVYYGVINALKGISFHVDKGEIVSLIGANGAGKTTTLHTITGLIRPKSGSICYKGQELTHVPAHKIVSMGMVHVPEGRRIFQNLSVYENLMMGAYSQKDKAKTAENMELVFNQFPRLKERRRQLAGTLSGGEQQMLAMGRALLANPELIVLDEPSMGLSPLLVSEIFEISAEGIEDDKRSRVSDMEIVVNGRAAGIDANLALLQRHKLFLASGLRIIDLHDYIPP